MAKIIITTTEEKNWSAHKVIETLVDFSVIKKDENKYEINTNSDDGTIKIELSLDEFQKLLNKMSSLKRDSR